MLLGNRMAGAHGSAVLLGNGMAGFHGGAVLVGTFIASGETHCNGGFQVVLAGNVIRGFQWWCGVFREWHGRFPWWCGVSREFHWKWLNAL